VPMDEAFRTIPVGRSEVLKEGRDLVLAFGNMVYPALAAARLLENEGLSLAVVNARFVKPLDEDILLRFAGPGRTIVTVEEGVQAGGAGSAVREFLDREKRYGIRFKSIGLPLDLFPVGKSEEIRRMLGLDVDGLVERFREVFRDPLCSCGDEKTDG